MAPAEDIETGVWRRVALRLALKQLLFEDELWLLLLELLAPLDVDTRSNLDLELDELSFDLDLLRFFMFVKFKERLDWQKIIVITDLKLKVSQVKKQTSS